MTLPTLTGEIIQHLLSDKDHFQIEEYMKLRDMSNRDLAMQEVDLYLRDRPICKKIHHDIGIYGITEYGQKIRTGYSN